MTDTFSNSFLRDEDGGLVVVGKDGSAVGGGDVTQSELDDAVSGLQTDIDANNAKFIGTYRYITWDGAAWVPDDGDALGDRTGDAGRGYFWKGPQAALDALTPPDFDLAVATDGV